MDSAQENFPHLWVNGEKYVFSDDVIAAGDSLYRNLLSVRDFASKMDEFSEEIQQSELIELLNKFEAAWVTYE